MLSSHRWYLGRGSPDRVAPCQPPRETSLNIKMYIIVREEQKGLVANASCLLRKVSGGKDLTSISIIDYNTLIPFYLNDMCCS